MSCLYILEIDLLSVASFANIFFHSEACLFALFMVSFVAQKPLMFNEVLFVYFCFYFHYSRRWGKKNPAAIYVKECFAYVFLYEFYSLWPYIQVFNRF